MIIGPNWSVISNRGFANGIEVDKEDSDELNHFSLLFAGINKRLLNL